MSRAANTPRTPRARDWLAPLTSGAAVGAIAGALEVALQMGRPGSALQRGHLFEAVVLYGAVGLLVGLGLLLLSGLARRRPPSRALADSVAVAVFVFLLVGGYVNLHYLPEALASTSLIYTGFLLAGALVLGVALYLFRRALERARAPRGARRRQPYGWLLSLLLLAALALVSYLPGATGRPAVRPASGSGPNVLILLLDALRPDHLSLFGYERETSPAIDRLAGQAIVFPDATAQAPWTKPSTASLLTGRYPSAHGVNLMASGVPPAVELLSETLRAGGYRTAVFSANSFITPVFGFGRGVEHFYASRPPRLAQLMLGHLLMRLGQWSRLAQELTATLTRLERGLVGGGAPEGGLRADGLTRSFLGWLDRIGDDPFYAYLHYMEPHTPYDPPAPYDTRFMSPELATLGRVTEFPSYAGFLPFEEGRAVSADSLANMVALYDGEIRYADEWIARLLEELRARNLFDHTLIVLTADHGEEFHERGGWGHGHSLYQELLRVPLILSYPARFGPGGQRFSQEVRHIDLVPTILDLCELPHPDGLDGASLLPILSGEERSETPRPIYSEVDHGGHAAQCLREGSQKVIFCRRGAQHELMFFDLARDPGERHNLTPEQTARADRALERLLGFRQRIAQSAAREVTVTIDEATRQQLEALGYIH